MYLYRVKNQEARLFTFAYPLSTARARRVQGRRGYRRGSNPGLRRAGRWDTLTAISN
jgi:hypothetical protein